MHLLGPDREIDDIAKQTSYEQLVQAPGAGPGGQALNLLRLPGDIPQRRIGGRLELGHPDDRLLPVPQQVHQPIVDRVQFPPQGVETLVTHGRRF
jgi:hypothetical protein